jgi:hypothetical protein
MEGKKNIAIGFLTMGIFMLYGFLLIYLRGNYIFKNGKKRCGVEVCNRDLI